jgi:glycosyltransferase involved in cell wall biosynthesis
MLSDEVVFISQWLSDYFYELGFNGKRHVIYNGCDKSHFVPSSIKKPAKKLKLVTHHWSDNWMKGFDLYTNIDRYLQEHDDFEFTYVGRYCKEYEPKATRIIEPLHGKALAHELQKHDIYVTASRWEPCGMHHIEGAAVGLPVIYHADTGGIKEFCVNHGIEYTCFDEFLKAVDVISKNYDDYVEKIDYDFLDINRCCKSYYDIMINMHSL